MRNDTVSKDWRSKLINPVLDKEFRLRMRTPRTMWTLLAYLFAIGLFALSSIYLLNMSSGNAASFNPSESRMLFYFLSFVQLGLISFMAPGLTAGVISGERERQTLNLLLTTQQSSTTIILSKLLSSLSFMILIVISTLPVYSMVFLFGGISPAQLLLIFFFYLFLMIVIGAFGILFSTIVKRTMIAVILTYGVTLFLYAGTALIGYVAIMVSMQVSGSSASNEWIVHIFSWNPAVAMYSILDPNITREIVYSGSGSTASEPFLQLWQEFMLIYLVLAALAIWLSIRYLRPRMKQSGK
ncbi:ABC-type transport system involved in multi-copper enzyme maturation, permease component [Paenibacillus algorifonticola]|uniref:ABC-type transport system involved in multi-copper enzyme maturation, permease component n=1 Tax=Paenibacillus algorifonticola TaxID=684063 RepID=A0A1I1YEZ3_9BACL|nr:ABC transporter permease [Paenibacillus algorifonticola]SFE18165.1 ABC-type transport system involved in multi-copper enzyme maturation, permease component [Paenibacillus algorifonticola]